MPSSLFMGGVAKVVIDGVGGDFIYNVSTNPDVVTIPKFAREGNTWPDPAPITDGLSNDREGPTGEKVPFAFNALNMDPVEVDALRASAFIFDRKDLQFTSKDGKTVVEVKNVVLRVTTNPINEFGKYGFVRFEGEATAAGTQRAYTVVYTP